MDGWGRGHHRTAIGVDGRPGHWRMIALTREREGWVLARAMDNPGAARAMPVRRGRGGRQPARVVAALSGQDVHIVWTTVPAGLSPHALEARMRMEAVRYRGSAADNLHIDYWIRGPVPERPQWLDVLLVSARQQDVDRCCDDVATVAGRPECMDVRMFALERAIRWGAAESGVSLEGWVAVLHVSDEDIHLAVLSDGQGRYWQAWHVPRQMSGSGSPPAGDVVDGTGPSADWLSSIRAEGNRREGSAHAPASLAAVMQHIQTQVPSIQVDCVLLTGHGLRHGQWRVEGAQAVQWPVVGLSLTEVLEEEACVAAGIDREPEAFWFALGLALRGTHHAGH